MVFYILKQTIAFLKRLSPLFHHVEYFADECAAQYKNFTSFLNLMHHQVDFGVPASWSFHARSYGKGACDGIGGSVKRALSLESLRRNAASQILDVHAMIQFCQNSFPAIHFELITSDDLQSASPDLQKRF